MPDMDQVTEIAAKLTVLIEGIADHKMTVHSQEALATELLIDIWSICSEGTDHA